MLVNAHRAFNKKMRVEDPEEQRSSSQRASGSFQPLGGSAVGLIGGAEQDAAWRRRV